VATDSKGAISVIVPSGHSVAADIEISAVKYFAGAGARRSQLLRQHRHGGEATRDELDARKGRC
jgi:hypothetical protein